MDQGTAPDTARWTLRSRGPAHTVSHRCLELQRAARPRGALARIFGLSPLLPDAEPAYRASLCERRVGRILARLGPEWRVLHAVPHGEPGSDIGHLVIGPPGVFTITTSTHLPPAQLQARVAARALSRATGIDVDASPLVALAGRPAAVLAGPASVRVLPAARLVRHLRGLPARLDADVVATLTRAAEEWTTWRPFGVDLPAHTDPDEAFERLRADVEGARAVRLAWGVSATLVPVAGLALAASGILF